MSHIFISYSRSDIDYVKKLEQRLVSEGFSVWRDNHIRTGDAWWQVVKNNLRDAAVMLVVMTETAASSTWVLRETAIADFLEKPVFPLLLSGEPQGDAWSIYAFIHYTDVRNNGLPDANFYEHLGHFAPRHKIAGGVRVDGVYLCKREKALFHEGLRFYANQSVTSFMLKPNAKLNNRVGSDEEAMAYRVEDEEIRFEMKTGRALICRFRGTELTVRVEYPSLPPDFRAYEFVPFE
jgi:hypothetical protein